ncbi:polarized growth protein-like protein Boi2 [Clathrospora elynae]|uniref:Polarized growth protein-like protein Boi2 n=1 Tax=Clathrospora elynae TaxID=706981 RepID=A0A6A5SD93_9PLEO|nr:polarized growth protein-like protein Boi2 [Clathrospora elynae]
MAQRSHTESCRPGDTLVVVHEFLARSPDELSLRRGDRIELIERDDDFGDGWFLGKNTETGDNGLFPEVYTRPAPKPTPIPTMLSRDPSQMSMRPTTPAATPGMVLSEPPTEPPLKATLTEPLNVGPAADIVRRTSLQTGPRSISMTLNGEAPPEDAALVPIGSPVMHETLSVIDEHITGMSTPRHSGAGKELRTNDSGSEYSSHHRLSYLNGQETDEEERNWHTEDEVRTWSPARVAEYLEDVGVEKKHCDVFRDQDIDGEALLGVDRNFIFMQEFALGPMGPRLRTWMKINALQSEVQNARDAANATPPLPALDGQDEFPVDVGRSRAASTGAVLPRIGTLRDSMGSRGSSSRQHMPRAASSAGRATMDARSPLIQHTPASPPPGSPVRPSAASVRTMNHSRRHSSTDHNSTSAAAGPSTHRKTPSFDRNWTMGATPKSPHELKRPQSSHHAHTSSTTGTAFDAREAGLASTELDRGYFSGGELDNRRSRNVLRKRESQGQSQSQSHSRNPSYNTDAARRASYSQSHSRIGSADSALRPASPISSAAKQYYGASIKSERSSSAFDFVRPLKPTSDMHPTVTKLTYDTHSIDAIANSPHIPGSETSSTGRASPSPAAQTHTRSFFSKKSQPRGLRAISDAITGGEKANLSAADVTTSKHKDSPMQSPSRTGSSTPSGASLSKSFELDKVDVSKRLTGSSAATKEARKKAKKHGTSAYLKGRQQITPQQAMENCDYSGWMKKKSSSLMTTWKTRLFVLRGRRLAYYYTEHDTEEKGLIDISSHRVLPANNERMTGFHASITGAASSPSSPQNATIQTTASADSAKGIPGFEEDMAGMFIFKLVPPRAGLQKGVQFTKPIVHYFAVDSLAVGRLWMAALMKATIDRDEALPFTTTYQQKTISLEKARAMRQRPPNLMDDDDTEAGSADAEKKSQYSNEYSKESIQESVIHEEDEKGLAISGLDDAKAMLAYADNHDSTENKHDSTATAIAT